MQKKIKTRNIRDPFEFYYDSSKARVYIALLDKMFFARRVFKYVCIHFFCGAVFFIGAGKCLFIFFFIPREITRYQSKNI